jgi:hypothetical protein
LTLKLIAGLPTDIIDRMADKFKSAIRALQARGMEPRRDNGIEAARKTEFQQILEECLTKLVDGTSTVEESLARYPEHANELRPLLRTVYFLNFRREEKPAPVYETPVRANITRFLKPRPSRSWNPTLFWRTAVVFAVLAIAVLVTGTASAQSALPGDTFYGWKRLSEEVWRAFSTDRVATEIAISNRRISELIAVADDPALSDSAMKDYLETLDRLKSVQDEKTLTRIAPVLKSQHEALEDVGIAASELETYLVVDLGVLPATVASQVPPTDSPESTTDTAQEPVQEPDPTEPKPDEPEPTAVPTEPEPTSVPTEPAPTVPTEPEPTSVPTEPESTSVPTEATPVPTEPETTPVPNEPGTTPQINDSGATPVPTEPPATPVPTDAPGNAPTVESP